MKIFETILSEYRSFERSFQRYFSSLARETVNEDKFIEDVNLDSKAIQNRINKYVNFDNLFFRQCLSDDHDDSIWRYVGESQGVKIWKYKASDTDDESFRWPCVKSKAIIDCPTTVLLKLLIDSTKAPLINRYSIGRVDVVQLDETSKIVWNKTKYPLSFRPFDCCNFIQYIEIVPGSNRYLIITKSVEHENVPITKEFARGYTFLGLNLLEPVPSNPKQTSLTVINHARYPGVPYFLASRYFFSGTVDYLVHLNQVVQRLETIRDDALK